MFVDVLTPELRAQMTPEEWKIWKRVNARPANALAAYPDLERQDFEETLDQTAAAAALKPMPVVVLTASDKFIDVVPKLIQAGELPPDTPPDFGAVVDRTNSAAQRELAALVPGAVHMTDTHAGHNIMIDNAPVVIQAIRMVVDPRSRGDGLTDVLGQHRTPSKPWGAAFNLRLEMLVSFRFLLVARDRTLMCVFAASHRWARCALVSAPALRHNRRQALATASLHWQSSPSQARCPSGERVRLR